MCQPCPRHWTYSDKQKKVYLCSLRAYSIVKEKVIK